MRENVFLLKEIIRSLSMEGTDYGLLVHEDGAFGVSSIAVESRCSKHVLVMEARTLGPRGSHFLDMLSRSSSCPLPHETFMAILSLSTFMAIRCKNKVVFSNSQLGVAQGKGRSIGAGVSCCSLAQELGQNPSSHAIEHGTGWDLPFSQHKKRTSIEPANLRAAYKPVRCLG
jgi:hypothetical protein